MMTQTLTWMHGVGSCSGKANIVIINLLALVESSIDHSALSIFGTCNPSLLLVACCRVESVLSPSSAEEQTWQQATLPLLHCVYLFFKKSARILQGPNKSFAVE